MIINNLTRENHLYHLKGLFKDANEIYIISPYITNNINLFDFSSCTKLKKICIVTTLKPFDKDQYSKVKYFKTLYGIFNQLGIEFKILVENSLHGKIFISKVADSDIKAVITSANFTDNGLRINNEWGILINDFEEINKIKNGILDKVRVKEIDEHQLDKFIARIAEIPKPVINANPISLNLSELFQNIDNFFAISSNNTFWLKPIGVSGDIISKSRKFDEVDEDLHFSKLNPKGVRKGDILICYAVGHLNILSIYKVKSDVKATNLPNDRWPYYVIGENLTPNYGREWSNHNINITNQKHEVLSKGLFNITPSGLNSYGSLMRGADKLRLTPDFGSYLLDKITRLDSVLKKE